MNQNVQLANIEQILETAAEDIGDITQPTLDLFYSRVPEAKEMFSEHGYDDKGMLDLESSMVEQTMYCVMIWYERSAEVKIVLQETVPHHAQTLNIPVSVFTALLNASIDTVASVIPEAESKLHETLEDLRESLIAVVDCSYSS